MTWTRLVFTLAARCFTHPTLARDLIRVAWRFRARRWYARFPFLPIPAREYMRWRMVTAYGDAATVPPAEDLVKYARWVGKQPR